MNLLYYLDLEKLCNFSTPQIEMFFRFVYDVFTESCSLKERQILESFIRNDDDDLLRYNHKSGVSLLEMIFNSSTGEVFNRMIPAIWNRFEAKDSTFISKIPYGKLSPEACVLHPNARLTSKSYPREVWHIEAKDHYYDFRYHQIKDKVLSSDCDNFLPLIIPKIIFGKKAIASYKKMGKPDMNTIISDLEKLNEYVNAHWTSREFQIEDFSKSTGVDASDESDSTKNDPKLRKLRCFSIDGIGSVYCFLHIKISHTYRIHFYPDKMSRLIHVAYIGKHLKTATSR